MIVDSEGAIEEGVKSIHKAMCDKQKKQVNLQFFFHTQWMHYQFLEYLSTYLSAKKAKKVNHVKVDLYIEEKE